MICTCVRNRAHFYMAPEAASRTTLLGPGKRLRCVSCQGEAGSRKSKWDDG